MTYSWRHSVVVRLALGYFLLAATSVGIVSAVFYVNTAGLLVRNVDRQLLLQAARLKDLERRQGESAVIAEVNGLLSDDKDMETEEYLVLDATEHRTAGNLDAFQEPLNQPGAIHEATVRRLGKDSPSHLVYEPLSHGGVLIVGRDMRDLRSLQDAVTESLALGAGVGLLLAIAGADFFRKKLRQHLALLKETTNRITEGNLGHRVMLRAESGEFSGIAEAVNAMLDRLETLMVASQTFTNNVSHELRTPLGRARATLEGALRFGGSKAELEILIQQALADIEAISRLFEKLLQLAEADNRLGTQSFVRFDLVAVAEELVDLYGPSAQASGKALTLSHEGAAQMLGDRDLIGNCIANVLDNAIKYANPNAQIAVVIKSSKSTTEIAIEDDGPGVEAPDIARLGVRFYRTSAHRGVPGTGLGLAMVRSLTELHGGELRFEDAMPGLRVVMRFPTDSRSE